MDSNNDSNVFWFKVWLISMIVIVLGGPAIVIVKAGFGGG